jgi:hypothetical protein
VVVSFDTVVSFDAERLFALDPPIEDARGLPS